MNSSIVCWAAYTAFLVFIAALLFWVSLKVLSYSSNNIRWILNLKSQNMEFLASERALSERVASSKALGGSV